MGHILVTGATGTVGREVVRCLCARGVAVHAAILPQGEARPFTNPLVTYVPFDFMQPATYNFALAGVRKLFLMRPPALANTKKYIDPAIRAAQDAGVEHIVFLSVLGAEKNPVVPHHAIEESIKATGVAWTFLRPSFFMQNFLTTHRADLVEHDAILVPAGRGKTSFIDARDIAAVAAKVLTEAGHHNTSYPLTGSEALDYATVAHIFSEALGRPIRYRDASVGQFIRSMRRRGFPLAFILVMVAIYTTVRLGLADTVTDDTVRLLGRPPITLRTFVEDYKERWMRATQPSVPQPRAAAVSSSMVPHN